MSVKASVKYEYDNEAAFRDEMRRDLRNCRKVSEPLILQSPDGTFFKLTVADDGTLGTNPV